MKPMLPSLTFEIPLNNEFLYEVKYDGFRAILTWSKNDITLKSRNGHELIHTFPEIKVFLMKYKTLVDPFLPLTLDGEIVLLENPFKGDFASLQKRGRLKSTVKIHEKSLKNPCRFLAFDMLLFKGKSLVSDSYLKRKETLKLFFNELGFNLSISPSSNELVQYVSFSDDFNQLWRNIILFDGEGVISKRKNSKWEEGKRSVNWLKFKNWKLTNAFITAFDKKNGYIQVAVYKNKEIFPIGQILFGLKPEEKSALLHIVKANKRDENNQFIFVDPALCIRVKYLELYDDGLREPHFDSFRFDLKPEDCTFEEFLGTIRNLPEDLVITHPNKPIWPKININKFHFIDYFFRVSSFLLPFLENRPLTVIRFPHGVMKEAFYQKNCPEYAPAFVKTAIQDGIEYILCNNIETLLWLANQLSLELHIPFQKASNEFPEEIVFDLDPPERDAFHLAVKAAQSLKEVLDGLHLTSFIKTSGNKGLQVYVPLPSNVFTYSDTRLFTTFIADYLITKNPDLFTIERLKKNRESRLYFDFLQHAEGKTIIAPYSARGNEFAGAAAPLYWEEVNHKLDNRRFTINEVLYRLQTIGDPFKDYFRAKKIQKFEPVLDFLKARLNQKG